MKTIVAVILCACVVTYCAAGEFQNFLNIIVYLKGVHLCDILKKSIFLLIWVVVIFTFSSWMRRYWFYVKNDFRKFHQIFTFSDPLSPKKGFYESVCLSVCLQVVCGITLDTIIRLNCAMAHFIGAEKVKTSSLTSHIQSKLRD